jgi:hypothetical protein
MEASVMGLATVPVFKPSKTVLDYIYSLFRNNSVNPRLFSNFGICLHIIAGDIF